jgi:hypothetical protein
VLEDRPLALCDSRSIDPEDLVPADRIIPDKVGEVYYLTHNPKHKWYWLEKQTTSEPFAFVMYDTKAGNHARCMSYYVHQFYMLQTDSCCRRLSTRLVRQPSSS